MFTCNSAAHLAESVAKSASSLVDFLERSKPVAILPPATVLTFLAQDGWHAEVLVHVGDEIGLPLLRIEGAPTQEEARSQLRQLVESPKVNEMASREDYHGMRFRAAIQAATT